MNTAQRDPRRASSNGGMGGRTSGDSLQTTIPASIPPSLTCPQCGKPYLETCAACGVNLKALASRGPRPRPRASGQRTGAEAFADEVRELWRLHHGLSAPWPRERRHDAILIGQAIRRYHLPLDFWKALFAGVPLGASFRLLTTRGRYGPSQLDDAAEEWRRSPGVTEQPVSTVTRSILSGITLRRMPA